MAQRARIACIVGDGFEDSELRVPYDELRGAGYEVEISGARAGQEITGKAGKERVTAERGIGEARPDDYVALLIPGGYSPDHLRIDPRFVSFVRAFDERQRLIAAVCHGPQLLLTAGLVKGRTLTAWPTVQEDLRRAGADVRDEEVVEDRNWITSRKPADLQAFGDAILQRLGGGAEERPGEGHAAQP
jgi:protease I